MTIPVQIPQVEFAGNGATTVFPVPFRYGNASHIKAALLSASGTVSDLANGTDFVATEELSSGGGSLTMSQAPAAGEEVVVWRDTDRAQTADYTETGAFPAATHEEAMDRAMKIAQEQDLDLARTIQVPRGEAGMEIPPAAVRANTVLGFGNDGLLSALTPQSLPFKGDPGSAGEGYPTRSALAAATVLNLDDAYLSEPGREGKFIYRSGDYTAHVAADPMQGYYVPLAIDPTGASGVWERVRVGNDIWVTAFGALGDAITDDYAAFQAASVFAEFLGHARIMVPAGIFSVSDWVFRTTSPTARITFQGAGQATQFFVRAAYLAADNPLFSAKGVSGARVNGCEINGFRILGRNDPAIDPVGIDTDYTNGFKSTGVFINGLRNEALNVGHAHDAYFFQFRTFTTGVAGGHQVRIGQPTVDNPIDNGNTIHWTDCTIEAGYGIGLLGQNVTNLEMISSKFHGIRADDPNFSQTDELICLENAGITGLVACEIEQGAGTGSNSGAVKITGSGKTTVTINGGRFDTIPETTYCIYYDSTNPNSRLICEAVTFNDLRTSLNYIRIASATGVGAGSIHIGGSNSFASINMEVEDTAPGADQRTYQRLLGGVELGGILGVHPVVGVPDPALGKNNDFAFRADGAAGSKIYSKISGNWVALA